MCPERPEFFLLDYLMWSFHENSLRNNSCARRWYIRFAVTDGKHKSIISRISLQTPAGLQLVCCKDLVLFECFFFFFNWDKITVSVIGAQLQGYDCVVVSYWWRKVSVIILRVFVNFAELCFQNPTYEYTCGYIWSRKCFLVKKSQAHNQDKMFINTK